MDGRCFHVWFSTKGRAQVLQEELAALVAGWFQDTAVAAGIDLIEIGVALDHVHLLLRLHSGQTLPSVVHRLKGRVSRRVSVQFPDQIIDMARGAFWQRGYGRREIDPRALHAIAEYVRTQADRPIRRRW